MKKKLLTALIISSISVSTALPVFASDLQPNINKIQSKAKQNITQQNNQNSEGRWNEDVTGLYHRYFVDGHFINGSQLINGDFYFFNNTFMQTGFFELPPQAIPAKLNAKTSGYYYFKTTGKIKDGLGVAQKGFQKLNIPSSSLYGSNKLNGKTFYFDDNYQAKLGWFNVGDNRYYSDLDNGIYTGPHTIGKNEYYFKKGGVMARNETVTIDGVSSWVDGDGVVQWFPWV